MLKFLSFSVLMALTVSAFSQGTNIPLGSEAYTYIQRFDVKYSKILPTEHVADHPYFRSKVAHTAEALLLSNLSFDKVQQYQLQWLTDENPEWLDSMKSSTHRPLWKFYQEPASLAVINSRPKGIFDIRFNPMLEVHVGSQLGYGFVFSRAIGVEVRGNIKHVFNFYFNATGNSARLPQYITNYTQNAAYNSNFAFLSGEAYWKQYSSSLFGFKDGVDYFDARGYVNVNILKYINITFGRDKNFIGDGIRSLFLSDNSAPYLFLKFNLDLGRFHYQSLFTQLTSQYVRGADQFLPQKYAAFHHLSIQATHWLDLGLFEGVIFSRPNTFELQYLNPIIFYRAVEHALGSPDNELLGGNFKANIAHHASIYGQLLLDEFNFTHFFKGDGWWANKWGLQLGFKYIDIVPHLDGQVEFNYVRPFTYTHEDTIINYTNYNQPLAHPLGANFYEFIFSLRLQPAPKLTFTLKYVVARMGDDTGVASGDRYAPYANFGGDILKPTNEIGAVNSPTLLGNKLGQGGKGFLNLVQLVGTYEIWHNVYLDAEITYRSRTSTSSLNNPTPTGSAAIIQIGGRWNISRKNYLF